MKIDIISEKKNYKRNLIRSNSFNSKIVFILLTKVITFYLKPIIIEIKEYGLKKFFLTFFLIFEPRQLFKLFGTYFFYIICNVNKIFRKFNKKFI